MIFPRNALFCLLGLIASASGCATMQYAQPVAVSNPMYIPVNNQEAIWEGAVDMLHDFQFPVTRENRLDGIIQTDYKVGSGVLEPWHHDSVGHDNIWESTFQSIRRRAFISIIPAEGGYLVGVEAFKEKEDLQGLAANSPGGATFRKSSPIQRDLNLAVGQTTPSGWIPQGRDAALENEMLRQLSYAFSR